MSELMDIGKFAETTGLSVAALRHYDDVGILKPAAVDPRTGYRRYDPDQRDTARVICSLRGVDLPIEEIRNFLAAGSEPETQRILELHRHRLIERADRLEQMLARSSEYVDQGVPVPTPKGCRVVQVMISTRDLDRSVRFYTEVFDLTFTSDFSSFALGAYDTDSFFLLTVENWFDEPSPAAFGLLVDDVDIRHRRAISEGATEISPPTDFGWKPRSSVIDDPSGNRVQLSQA